MTHGNTGITGTARALAADLANDIRDRLRDLGMNQSDLARRMGVHRAWVSRMMRGYVPITLREIGSMAESLHMHVKIVLLCKGGSKPTMTASEARERNRKHALNYYRKRVKAETPEEAEKRRAKAREYARKKYQTLTTEEKEKIYARNRESYRRKTWVKKNQST